MGEIGKEEECIKTIETIVTKIGKEMDAVRNLYLEATLEEDRRRWEGKWKGLIDAYTIAVETLAKVKKEVRNK